MPKYLSHKVKPGFLDQDVYLNKYTSWNIGGPARFFCEPESVRELRRGINFAKENGLDWTVIGNGSNLLVSDSGYDGMVIRIGPRFSDLSVKNEFIHVQSGGPLYNLADVANDYGCSCFNFVTGIPGTVGGAVTMNAGAFGHEVSDFITAIAYLNERGEVKHRNDLDGCFSYRKSSFLGGEEIVIGAQFELTQSSQQPSMSEFLSRRRNKLPYSFPSAGSVFKNPSHADKTAGEMLDLVGAKGIRVGDAVVSHKHANFIVNKGNATAKNVRNLIDILVKRVYKEFGVTLVTEIEVI